MDPSCFLRKHLKQPYDMGLFVVSPLYTIFYLSNRFLDCFKTMCVKLIYPDNLSLYIHSTDFFILSGERRNDYEYQ